MKWLREHVASFAIVVSVLTAILVFTGVGSAVAANIQSVLIANTSSQPVPTRELRPAPFNRRDFFDGVSGEIQTSGGVAALPTSVELDHVSMLVTLPSSGVLSSCIVADPQSSQYEFVPFVEQAGTVASSNVYVGNLSVKMRINAGEGVSLTCLRSAASVNGAWEIEYDISGDVLPS